jgi:hypothetical protein
LQVSAYLKSALSSAMSGKTAGCYPVLRLEPGLLILILRIGGLHDESTAKGFRGAPGGRRFTGGSVRGMQQSDIIKTKVRIAGDGAAQGEHSL